VWGVDTRFLGGGGAEKGKVVFPGLSWATVIHGVVKDRDKRKKKLQEGDIKGSYPGSARGL